MNSQKSGICGIKYKFTSKISQKKSGLREVNGLKYKSRSDRLVMCLKPIRGDRNIRWKTNLFEVILTPCQQQFPEVNW